MSFRKGEFPFMRTAVTSHIEIDDSGAAWITGAHTKVTEGLREKLAHGGSTEEIHREHPHLSLVQIYSAFVYYFEKNEKRDDEIAPRESEAEEIAQRVAGPTLQHKLVEFDLPLK